MSTGTSLSGRRLVRFLLPTRLSLVPVGVLVLVLLGTASLTPHAGATFPGNNGRIVFMTGPALADLDIASIEPDGSNRSMVIESQGQDEFPRWSPDGKRIVFQTDRRGSYDIYVATADGSDVRRLTSGGGNEMYPTWSPSGRKIAYTSVGDSSSIRVIDVVTGSSKRLRAFGHSRPQWLDWSANGRFLAFSLTNHDLYTMRADGSALRRLTKTPWYEWTPSWSPDSRFIAFTTTENVQTRYFPFVPRNMDIAVMRRDGSGTQIITTYPSYDTDPNWSPDGTKIVFESDEGDPGATELYVIDANGANRTRITTNIGVFDDTADWQPLP